MSISEQDGTEGLEATLDRDLSKHSEQPKHSKMGNAAFPILGVFLGAAFVALAVPTPNLWPLSFFALFLPVWTARKRSGSASFLYGWLFGTLIFLFTFTWVAYTLRVFAYWSRPMAWIGLVALAAFHGLSQGIWLLVVHFLRRHLGMPAWAALPVSYVPLEHFFFALFPWQLGIALHRMDWVSQIADLTGAVGLTFIVALVNGALVDLAEGIEAKKSFRGKPSPLFGWYVAGAVWILASIYGAVRQNQISRTCKDAERKGGGLVVGLVQPSFGIYEKEKKDKLKDHLAVLKELSKQAVKSGAEMVVWPETALQVTTERTIVEAEAARQGYLFEEPGALPSEVAFENVPLLTGGLMDGPGPSGGQVSYNAAFLIRPSGGIMGYALKNHLLMFGEYLPLEKRFPKLRKRFPNAGDLEPGTSPSVLVWNGIRMGIAVCYEDILTSFVRRLCRMDAHILMNLTNDSWFGKSREPAQHLALSALRSIETRKTMVRATNTGISAVIDPTGKVMTSSGLFERSVLVTRVCLLEGETFYVRFGPWLVFVCLGILSLVFFGKLGRIRKADRSSASSG